MTNNFHERCDEVAVNVCGNCGRACEKLHDLVRWEFKGCDECAEEAERADERDTQEVREFLVARGWTPFERGLSQDDLYINLSRDFGFTWELRSFDGESWSKPVEGDTVVELKQALGITDVKKAVAGERKGDSIQEVA
jgi:hypothetical protein